jgi:hypothetical protein
VPAGAASSASAMDERPMFIRVFGCPQIDGEKVVACMWLA